jgi:hypothetical protein
MLTGIVQHCKVSIRLEYWDRCLTARRIVAQSSSPSPGAVTARRVYTLIATRIRAPNPTAGRTMLRAVWSRIGAPHSVFVTLRVAVGGQRKNDALIFSRHALSPSLTVQFAATQTSRFLFRPTLVQIHSWSLAEQGDWGRSWARHELLKSC